MRILITGVAGMLGQDLWKVFEKTDHELIGLDVRKPSFVSDPQWRECDITDQAKTYQIISRYNPDCIIHTASYTDVDGCEKNHDLAYQVNGLGTRNLLLGAQRFDAVFLYISTDYVFGNDEKKIYSEYDIPHPVMQYAVSKYIGEEFVRDLSNKFYIVRISWLFGEGKKNFVLQMRDCILNNSAYKAVDDMIASPTYTVDLAKAIAFLIEKGSYGIYHITNSGYASRYEVGCTIAQLLGKNEQAITKTKLAELNLPAQRAHYSILANDVWRLNGYPVVMRPWKEAVHSFLKELAL